LVIDNKADREQTSTADIKAKGFIGFLAAGEGPGDHFSTIDIHMVGLSLWKGYRSYPFAISGAG
jgi:hypothetical protein